MAYVLSECLDESCDSTTGDLEAFESPTNPSVGSRSLRSKADRCFSMPAFTCYSVDSNPSRLCVTSKSFIRYRSFTLSGTVYVDSLNPVFVALDTNLQLHKLSSGTHSWRMRFKCSGASSWTVITEIGGAVYTETTGAFGPCLADTDFRLTVKVLKDFGSVVKLGLICFV